MNNLIPIKYKNIIVITTEQLAQVYETNVNNIKNNFNNNKDRFVEGIHYYFLQGEDLKAFKSLVNDIDQPINKFTSQLYLWTERGASHHCKILDNNKAWEQFDNLEEVYFKIKREPQQNFKVPQTYIEALEQLLISEKEKEQLQLKNQEQQSKIQQDAPKVSYYDLILQNKNLLNISQIAKDYGYSDASFNKLLHDFNIQYKQNGQWLLYHQYQNKGYTQSSTFIGSAFGYAHLSTKWTQSGRLFLYKLLKDKKILPIIEKELD